MKNVADPAIFLADLFASPWDFALVLDNRGAASASWGVPKHVAEAVQWRETLTLRFDAQPHPKMGRMEAMTPIVEDGELRVNVSFDALYRIAIPLEAILIVQTVLRQPHNTYRLPQDGPPARSTPSVPSALIKSREAPDTPKPGPKLRLVKDED